jgi:hypothetical protein
MNTIQAKFAGLAIAAALATTAATLLATGATAYSGTDYSAVSASLAASIIAPAR